MSEFNILKGGDFINKVAAALGLEPGRVTRIRLDAICDGLVMVEVTFYSQKELLDVFPDNSELYLAERLSGE